MKKTLSISIIFLIIAGILVLFFQNTNTSQNILPNPIQTGSTTKAVQIPATNKSWGISPFTSGGVVNKPVAKIFKTPITDWKARTITIGSGKVVTYRFGEGNPEEVSIPTNALEAFYSCKTPYEYRLRDGVCPETQYVTREIEIALRNALNSPLWEKVVQNCDKSFQATGGEEWFNSSFLSGNILDINKLLIIDSDGRKALAWTDISTLASMLNPEPRGDALSKIEPQSDCYQDRVVLSTMMSNIFSAYNVGALNEEEKLGSIKTMLNNKLPNKYMLVP